jgi:NAD(P)-dependent dehydrogenase (short-subunit alcohol dehydrogenase family)
VSGLLEGKHAIVFGAGSGVGRASAIRFAEEGAKVVVADVNEGAAKETATLVEGAGGTSVPFAVDVSQEDQVEAALAEVAAQFGSLDVVFNNVGIPTPQLGSVLEQHTAEDFDRLFSVNVGGVFYGCKHAVLRFKEQGTGGAIVNTGSVAGLVGWGGTVYGATKGAVHALTKSVAVEVAAFDIRVNAICPGAMPFTGFMAAGGVDLPEDSLQQVAESVGAGHPLGRPITAEDCAEVAAFLASDRASNLTGLLVPVDGGYVAK